MKPKITWYLVLLASAAMLLSAVPSWAGEGVEMNILKTMKLDSTPVDMASSADGSRIFVLTDQGEIIVYSPKGQLQGRVAVDKDVDQIRVSPKGNSLLLSSRKNKTVQVVSIDFIVDVDVAGSPFKGPENAPVVVAVFSDFQ